MRIAFDVDGVLRENRLGFFKLCTEMGSNDALEALKIETESSVGLKLNPLLFATKDDEIYALTNCGSTHSAMQKREWLKHFYGDRIKFLAIEIAKGLWKKDYCDATAKAKVDIMLREGIEVYFDDDPAIIKVMRTLTDKIKFIKYGSWVDEYY
jgi:hypothetical protein